MEEFRFISNLEEDIEIFMSRLKKSTTPGKYFSCATGRTPHGDKFELGTSCFALKLFHTFGWWESLSVTDRSAWISFLQSFQISEITHEEQFNGAYVDKALLAYLTTPSLDLFLSRARLRGFRGLLTKPIFISDKKSIKAGILAETKQVLATLLDLGVEINCKFASFPRDSLSIKQELAEHNWSMPWEAGGRAACQAVFISALEKQTDIRERGQQAMCDFYSSIADSETGAYFMGPRPPHRILINGAMKVLTALDWLGERIHYPERLIDSVLQTPPSSKGCDLVDAVYVLYRCSLVCDHRKSAVRGYLLKVLSLIEVHKQKDGGFSYYKQHTQRWYYGMPISKGYKEGDMHGTVLLVWAIAMIVQVIAPDRSTWNVIRP